VYIFVHDLRRFSARCKLYAVASFIGQLEREVHRSYRNKENGCAAVVRISRRVDFFKHGLTEIADGIVSFPVNFNYREAKE